MRTTLVFATMAVAITLSGCATPNLQGVVPFDAEIQRGATRHFQRSCTATQKPSTSRLAEYPEPV